MYNSDTSCYILNVWRRQKSPEVGRWVNIQILILHTCLHMCAHIWCLGWRFTLVNNPICCTHNSEFHYSINYETGELKHGVVLKRFGTYKILLWLRNTNNRWYTLIYVHLTKTEARRYITYVILPNQISLDVNFNGICCVFLNHTHCCPDWEIVLFLLMYVN